MSNKLPLIPWMVLFFPLCGWAQVEAAAPAGTCVSAQVRAPFSLPNGELHAAGTLTLCNVRQFSPVAELHRISVNRRPVGMFLSRMRTAEAVRGEAPQIVFRREGDGTLELVGYTLPTRGRSLAYHLSGFEREVELAVNLARLAR